MAVERIGLDPANDVQWITTGGMPANSLTALIAGQAQAAPLSQPFGAASLQQGFKKLIGVELVAPGQPFTGVAALDTLVQEKPDVVRRMILATLATMVWMKEHRDATLAIMRQEFEVEPAIAEIVYDEVVDGLSLDGRATDQGVRAVIEQTLADVPVQQVSVGQVQDLRLLDEILAERPWS